MTIEERLKRRVSHFIGRHSLIDPSRLYVVALSGGADSVALLLLMRELGYRVDAAHCNFHLRPVEADRDEEFVKGLTASLSVPLHIAHFDTAEYARSHHLGMETAARKLRYAYLFHLMADIGADAILTGHHSDDNVETVMMNITRGAGINGVCGIPVDNGRVRRPLLCLSHDEIVDYLNNKGQPFMTDSTNLSDVGARNMMRLRVIPLLRQINPRASENINATARHLSEAMRIVCRAVRSAKDRCLCRRRCPVGVLPSVQVAVDKERLLAFASPEYLLYDICGDYGFAPAQTEEIVDALRGQAGRVFLSPSHSLLVDREVVIIEKKSSDTLCLSIPEAGLYRFGTRGLRVSLSDDVQISRLDNRACMDADKVMFPLTLRLAQEGDRFQPFGMRGSILVSDYLTNRKRNLFDKRRQMVVCDASGSILWLVGERIADPCRIVPSATTRMVVMEIVDMK